MGTQVVIDPRLAESVRVFGSVDDAIEMNPTAMFDRAELMVIDGVRWAADMAVIRSGLIGRQRAFKQAFQPAEPADAVQRELDRLGQQADEIFKQLFPSLMPLAPRRDSFRPMISGPEPLHFDTYSSEVPLVTSFINVSNKARVYRIGHSFPDLVAKYPALMRQVAHECQGGDLLDMSYQIRTRTVGNLPPLDATSPRHVVRLAPHAIWFFNAKTVSHELVSGEGAMSFSWVVPNCRAPRQGQLMESIL